MAWKYHSWIASETRELSTCRHEVFRKWLDGNENYAEKHGTTNGWDGLTQSIDAM